MFLDILLGVLVIIGIIIYLVIDYSKFCDEK